MKKKKTAFKAAVLVLVIGIGIMAAFILIKMYGIEKLKNQQNYMASRLIEMGAYEQGRVLAIQNNQMKENAIAQELIVLSSGFQSDYESGIRSAEKFMEKSSDAILQETVQLYSELMEDINELTSEDELVYQDEKQKLEEDAFEELMAVLFRIEDKINVKADKETLQTMLDIMSSVDMVSYEALEALQDDNSVLGMKVQVAGNLKNRNYSGAFETAKLLYKKNDSFENKALLANITAIDGKYQGMTEGNGENSGEAAQRAINFIETTTAIGDRKQAAYDLERAYLYFCAGNENKSKELLKTVLGAQADHDDTIAVMLDDFLYKFKTGSSVQTERRQYQAYEQDDLSECWKQISQALYFIETDNSFYEFVLGTADELYNGLIIRNIDTTLYPEVHITVNIAFDTEKEFKKEDFVLKDMGAEVDDFSVTSAEELSNISEASVVLAVDHSGSMDGEPLEATKKAVVSFVNSISHDINVGLVEFDDMAQVVTPLTGNASAVVQGVQTIESGGGTSIWSGLQTAGDELMSEMGRKIIILLSDGEDGDTSKIDEVLNQLRQNNIYVYTIGFGGADTEYLSYIANSCQGKFLQAQSSDMLGEIYNEIGSYMVNEYMIVYEAVLEPENFSRICSVALKQEGLFAEKEYHVGVDYNEIEAEEGKRPVADYFREIGGSRKDAE